MHYNQSEKVLVLLLCSNIPSRVLLVASYYRNWGKLTCGIWASLAHVPLPSFT